MRSTVACRISVLLLLLCVLAPLSACDGSTQLAGVVFEDHDRDGIRDDGEPGIRDIMVTNGTQVVVTNDSGEYALSEDGRFVFVTTSSRYQPSTTWYKDATGHDLDFGLVSQQSEPPNEFVFVQMTDVHLDGQQEHLQFFEQAVEEIGSLSPDFVVSTGDLVIGAEEAEESQARVWYDAYSGTVEDFSMPLYNALGNHDVVGIYRDGAAETDQGHNKEMYYEYFGPTYYSFDWGNYHCLVLDPNELDDGRQVYRIPDEQLEWLRGDLSHRESRPLLVFFHEPTPSWENRAEVLNILADHGPTTLFAGHWHQDVLLSSQGFHEQATGALCGEWWFGPCPDGNPSGYRIVCVGEEGISSFYRGAGAERQIDVADLENPTGEAVTLRAEVFSEYGRVEEASYRIDGGDTGEMSIQNGQFWDTATAMLDTAGIEDGYHVVTIVARDAKGTFSEDVEFKFGDRGEVTIDELVSHFETYQGKLTTVGGSVDLAVTGDAFGLEGSGAVIFSDQTGSMLAIIGECISPPPPSLESGDTIEITAIPLKYSWEFLQASQQFSLIQQFASFLPEGLLIGDEAGPRALLLMRLPSGDGIQK
jgi:Icc protein